MKIPLAGIFLIRLWIIIARKIKPTIYRFSTKNSNKIYEIGKVPILPIPMLPSKTGFFQVFTWQSIFCCLIIMVYYIHFSNFLGEPKNKFSQKLFWWSHWYFAYISISNNKKDFLPKFESLKCNSFGFI
jgi:hypothetical protein